MVLTAYFVLSPATNSSCHRHPRIEVLSARSGRLSLREFNTSNGCQDHTASPSAKAPIVSHAAHEVHLALRLPLRARRCRVHRIPFPTSVTIAKRPLWVGTDWICF